MKTSSRCLDQDQHIRLGHTSSRRLQDVFKTSSRRLAKTSSRHLQDVFKTFWKCFQDVFKTFSRHLDQDEYICLIHTSSEDVFKTSWSRPIYSSWSYIFKTSSRRLAKMSSKRLQEVFKTSSRLLAKISSRRFQDVSSSYTVLVNKFSRCLQEVFTTFLRRTATIDLPIYLDRSI